MSSSPPTTLGKYQIIREIARSNDIVYEGYDPQMTRRVAVKELNMPGGATAQQQEDRVQRFKREAQAAGRLNHPNIMTVYDVEEDAGRLFMAMEYLDGGTLRAEIDGKGRLEPERAVEIARAVLAGLAHAHSQGVVHRDIKPDNVQILSNGSIKITDFGIARLTFQPNLTMDGQVFGTPSYMSPEQVVGKEIDPRSDIFSVGVMLYEMLAGVKPFAGDSVVAITYAIMNREPEPLPDAVPWAVGEAIRQSLEKTPHLRFDDAAKMSAALEEAIRPAPAAPPPAAYNPPAYSTPAPQYSPYAPVAAPPVVHAPYNPYGAPPQVPPQGPPPSFGYNPYTQQPYGGPGPTMAPPGGPAPVYYPPPPRQPLLKPETSAFIKKLTVSFIVLGTFFALLMVGVWALFKQFNRINDTANGQSIVDSLKNIDRNLPLEKQIEALRERKSRLGPDADSSEIDRRLGEAYQEAAAQETRAERFANAEPFLQQAYYYDPHNAGLLTDYGYFYETQATKMPEGSLERAERYHLAYDKYIEAAGQEVDRVKKAEVGVRGAGMAYYYALNAKASGDATARRAARKVLAAAQPYATDNPQLNGLIEGLLREM